MKIRKSGKYGAWSEEDSTWILEPVFDSIRKVPIQCFGETKHPFYKVRKGEMCWLYEIGDAYSREIILLPGRTCSISLLTAIYAPRYFDIFLEVSSNELCGIFYVSISTGFNLFVIAEMKTDIQYASITELNDFLYKVESVNGKAGLNYAGYTVLDPVYDTITCEGEIMPYINIIRADKKYGITGYSHMILPPVRDEKITVRKVNCFFSYVRQGGCRGIVMGSRHHEWFFVLDDGSLVVSARDENLAEFYREEVQECIEYFFNHEIVPDYMLKIAICEAFLE